MCQALGSMRGLEGLRTPLRVTPLPHLHEGLTAELADRRAGAPTCCDHAHSRLFLQIQSLVNPAALLFTCQMARNVRLFLEGLTTGEELGPCLDHQPVSLSMFNAFQELTSPPVKASARVLHIYLRRKTYSRL